MQVRDVPAGETVGYSQGYRAEAPVRVATCGTGYADGVMRSNSPNGQVWVAGTLRPIIGRVSMDVLAVDVTAWTWRRATRSRSSAPIVWWTTRRRRREPSAMRC